MGMPIREKQVCSIQIQISRPRLGRWHRSRLDHGGPERVTTAPPGPHEWSLSRTVMIPSGIIYHSAFGPSWTTVSYSEYSVFRPSWTIVSYSEYSAFGPL